MLNLLPQQEKKKLIGDYKIRFGITVATFACLLIVIAIVGLFPSYMGKKSEMETLIDWKNQADLGNSEESLAEAARLTASNKALGDYLETRIVSLEASPQASFIVGEIFSRKTSAISLRSVEVAGKEVAIRGVAATRADLISFHSALRKEILFKSASLPIADIAKSTQAEFTIFIILP